MANATKVPNLFFGQWSVPDAPTPTLDAPISNTDTTLVFSAPLLDAAGAVCSKDVIIGIRKSNGYVESVYIAAGNFSVDGLTATNCVRGIDLEGLDYTVGDSDLATSHLQGEAVLVNVTGVYESILNAFVRGTIASGGTGLIIGTDADGTVTVSRSTGAGTSVGWLRWNTSVDMVQFSNDGAVWTNISDSVASSLVKVTAADTTPGYLNDKIDVATAGRLTKSTINGAGNERLGLTLATTLTDAEMNLIHTGISANVTGTNLATLTAGVASNADALHTHNSIAAQSLMAYETITVTTDPVAVAELPIEVQHYAQITDGDRNLGDSNTKRKYAIKWVPAVTSSTLTTIQFRGKEAVNGATVGNLDISIQTDNAGAPSGTVITNGSANQITQATLRTWGTSYANRTATWAASPTLTAGTVYWLVFSIDATDAANYLKLGVPTGITSGSYLPFTSLIYNLDTGTWGNTFTDTFFFWFNSQPQLLGQAVGICDADILMRTWSFIGFVTTTTAAFATASVKTSGVITGFTTLLTDPDAEYYISATAGQITATAPGGINSTQGIYVVGRALSSSALQIGKGLKRLATTQTFSSTTTANKFTGFKAKYIEIWANAVGANQATSTGFSDGTVNTCSFGGDAATAGGNDADSSWRSDEGAGSNHQGTVSAISDVGYTLSNTLTGGAANVDLTVIAYGD